MLTKQLSRQDKAWQNYRKYLAGSKFIMPAAHFCVRAACGGAHSELLRKWMCIKKMKLLMALFVRRRERARDEAPLNVLAAGGSNISMELTPLPSVAAALRLPPWLGKTMTR